MWPFVPPNVIHWLSLFPFRFNMFLFNGTIQPINRRIKYQGKDRGKNVLASISFFVQWLWSNWIGHEMRICEHKSINDSIYKFVTESNEKLTNWNFLMGYVQGIRWNDFSRFNYWICHFLLEFKFWTSYSIKRNFFRLFVFFNSPLRSVTVHRQINFVWIIFGCSLQTPALIVKHSVWVAGK